MQPDEVLPTQATDHPLYQRVEKFITRSDWLSARTALAELLTFYPQDRYLRDLSSSIAARTALLEVSQAVQPNKSSRSNLVEGLLRWGMGLGVVLGIIVLAVSIFFLFRLWIFPSISERQRESRINQLSEEAESTLAIGDYSRAVLVYNEWLELEPAAPDALAGLEQANQLRALVAVYGEAITEMEAHHWDSALTLLQEIEAQQPGYRDVAVRISFVEKQQTLTQYFQEAETLFEGQEYANAVEGYERLQSLDVNFQRDAVQDRLFFSYLQLALTEEATAGDDVEQLQSALEKFEKALTLHPKDSQAKGESQLISLYLAGVDNLKSEEWEQAIESLTPVVEARPDFADDQARQLLYEAYLSWGDELNQTEAFEQALVVYEAAKAIPEVDQTSLNARIDQTKIALAPPTPTPTPLPTATPVPANISSGAGRPVAATPTPQSYPYQLKSMSARSNCNGQGYIHGVVWSVYNLPLPNVTVQAFNTTAGLGPFTAMPTNQDGIYQIILQGDQIEGMWTVQVLDENGLPASKSWGQFMGGGCQNGIQELKVDWQYALGPSQR